MQWCRVACFRQGGDLYDTAIRTGGIQYLASDTSGVEDLTLFFTETSSRGCSIEESAAIVGRKEFKQNFDLLLCLSSVFN